MNRRSQSLTGLYVVREDDVTFDASPELSAMYKLSPFVWREEDRKLRLLLRVVNVNPDPSKKVARIHSGISSDGLHFVLDETPVIAPGTEVDSDDSGGCEDPSVVYVDGTYFVYYSGWNERLKRGQLLLASGPDLQHLAKRGIALPSTKTVRNPKEATIARAGDGTWRLFFEHAQEGRSKIGLASSRRVDGPWEVLPLRFDAREATWDSWHLSPGPIVDLNLASPVMFYNGGTRQPQWRIGWVAFDAAYSHVVERSFEPIVLPSAPRDSDDTDIAFAASAVEEGDDVHLYYSIADRYCRRAVISRR